MHGRVRPGRGRAWRPLPLPSQSTPSTHVVVRLSTAAAPEVACGQVPARFALAGAGGVVLTIALQAVDENEASGWNTRGGGKLLGGACTCARPALQHSGAPRACGSSEGSSSPFPWRRAPSNTCCPAGCGRGPAAGRRQRPAAPARCRRTPACAHTRGAAAAARVASGGQCGSSSRLG